MYNQTRIFKYSQETTRVGLQENDTICTINLALVVSMTFLGITFSMLNDQTPLVVIYTYGWLLLPLKVDNNITIALLKVSIVTSKV